MSAPNESRYIDTDESIEGRLLLHIPIVSHQQYSVNGILFDGRRGRVLKTTSDFAFVFDTDDVTKSGLVDVHGMAWIDSLRLIHGVCDWLFDVLISQMPPPKRPCLQIYLQQLRCRALRRLLGSTEKGLVLID